MDFLRQVARVGWYRCAFILHFPYETVKRPQRWTMGDNANEDALHAPAKAVPGQFSARSTRQIACKCDHANDWSFSDERVERDHPDLVSCRQLYSSSRCYFRNRRGACLKRFLLFSIAGFYVVLWCTVAPARAA